MRRCSGEKGRGRIAGLLGEDERGSVAIFTLFLLSLAMMLVLYLAYYYGGFISLRQAQNVADSAALAAAQELRNWFVEGMQDKTLMTVHTFLREIREEVEECEQQRKPGDPPCPTVADLIKQYIKQPELKTILLAKAFNKTEHWQLVVREPHFRHEYTGEKNGDVLYEAFLQNRQRIVQAALESAERNNGERSVRIDFPVEGLPRLEVNSAKAMRFDALDSGPPALIKAKAAAGIETQAFAVDVSRKVPLSIKKNWPLQQ